jgi:hypothetical protein
MKNDNRFLLPFAIALFLSHFLISCRYQQSESQPVAQPVFPVYGDLRGVVLDAVTRTPLPRVTVRTTEAAAITSADGTFYVRGVPQGSAIMTTTRAGYQPVTQGISIVKDQTSVVAIHLSPLPAGTLHGYDIIVVGAGTGGISAAVQAARMGMRTALLEETDWIGGQMTAAAVTSLDEGNPVIRTGIYREFHQKVADYYAARGKSTGTAYFTSSSTAFEPSVGQRMLYTIINESPFRGSSGFLDLYLLTKIAKVTTTGTQATGVATDADIKFSGAIVIDATEYGDLLPLAHARYRVGNGTNDAPSTGACIQPFTYTAVIKKYPGGVPSELRMQSQPPSYVEKYFNWYLTMDGHSWYQNDVFTLPINFDFYKAWRGMPDSSNPFDYDAGYELHGKITKTGMNASPNDYYPVTVDYLEDLDVRKQVNCAAKLKTLNKLYYLRNVLGETEWSVADDEGFASQYNLENGACDIIPSDYNAILNQFPLIPYVREGRRIIGIMTLTAEDIKRDGLKAYRSFPSALAVGAYPMDLHGCYADTDLDCGDKSSDIVQDLNKAGGLFQVPFEVFIPETVDGLLVAEKNLSVSRLVNGAIRLQPITMMTGQAAGALAAVAVRKGIAPRSVNPLEVQQELLSSGSMLSLDYFDDVSLSHRFWKHVQFVTLYEIMSAQSGSYIFGADSALSASDLATIISKASGTTPAIVPTASFVTREEFALVLAEAFALNLSGISGQLFTDVTPDNPAYAAIQTLAKKGIIFGCVEDNTRFCSHDAVSRGETAAFIANALWILERTPATFTGLITTDNSVPTGTILINNGGAITNSCSATLILSATDAGASVESMQFKKEITNWYKWEPYQTSRNVMLSEGDGLKTVSVRFRDSAGNASPEYSASILLDASAPYGTIVINGGAAETTSTAATVTLSAADANGVVSMQFSHDNATWYSWEPFAETRQVTLSGGPGEKTLFVKFKDAAGNISGAYSATITVL